VNQKPKAGQLNLQKQKPPIKFKPMKKKKSLKTKKETAGKELDRLKINGDWQAAVATALRKPKPVGGWPK